MYKKYHLSKENKQQIEAFLRNFRARGKKPTTIRNKMGQLKMFFGFLKKDWDEVYSPHY